MKNQFKHFIIMLIIVTMLSPFVEVQKVNAESYSWSSDNSSRKEWNKESATDIYVLKDLWSVLGITNDTVTFNSNEKEIIIPINIKEKGIIMLSISEFFDYSLSIKLTGDFEDINETNQEETYTRKEPLNFESLKIGVYKDAKCTELVDKESELIQKETTNVIIENEVNIKDKGTYYVKLNLKRKPNNNENVIFNMSIYSISSVNKTLSSGNMYYAYQGKDNEKILYKIKVTKSTTFDFGLQTIDYIKPYSAKIQLLDSNKKAISKKTTTKNKLDSDGEDQGIIKSYKVKKGTYYIQVETTCGKHFLGFYYE